MYVATFYSYKGGVGRTMGLVNVAWELARRGRKVLVVDFDLEAPGLTTFEFAKSIGDAPGIVDYVSEYYESLTPPALEPYVRKCEYDDKNGQYHIWVMSAGKQDADYKRKFHSINWEVLYSEKSGYLMFENLKGQWKDHLNPDYVLIDSRTGHTDISGICTRQLPDAVILSFFPNHQNLVGLKQVVSEIRQEADSPRQKRILTHFVASNVPDVDDDRGILEKHLQEFKNSLGYENFHTIHYYNNLSIVDQEVFTLSRQSTKLAREYAKLTDKVIQANPSDRDGAIAYLDRVISVQSRQLLSDQTLDAQMSDIRREHPSDGVIHSKLGDLLTKMGRKSEAITEYEKALTLGQNSSQLLSNLGVLYRQTGNEPDAAQMFLRASERRDDSDGINVLFAVLQLAEIDEGAVFKIINDSAILEVTPKILYAIQNVLRTKRSLIPAAISLLKKIDSDKRIASELGESPESLLVLCYIAVGLFSKAKEILGDYDSLMTSNNISSIFNYAMAEWGDKGDAPREIFERVIELENLRLQKEEIPGKRVRLHPNYAECIAVANMALRKNAAAAQWLKLSRTLANDRFNQWHEFSCWSYLNMTMQDFIEDLDKIEASIDSPRILPEFLTVKPLPLH